MKLRCLKNKYFRTGMTQPVFQGEIFTVPEALGKKLLADYPDEFEKIESAGKKQKAAKNHKMMRQVKDK